MLHRVTSNFRNTRIRLLELVRFAGLVSVVGVALSMLAESEGTDAALCSSESATIRIDYPTARLASCEVISANHFRLLSSPEDTPINPSPWYGFAVERITSGGRDPIQITLSYSEGFSHRYPPKFSPNRKHWRLAGENDVLVDEHGQAHFSIPSDWPTVFVSAQEILDAPQYSEWIHRLHLGWQSLETRVIGHSHDKRPITALSTNRAAEKFVLILGRQHPPEVPGGFALMHFVDRLAVLRSGACEDPHSGLCAFFRSYSLVIVPLVNPDGVARGYWRNNVGSTDLNRDWGDFKQPETAAVWEFVTNLMDQGKRLSLVLDFHSTKRNVLYTQTETDKTEPPQFAARWHEFAVSAGLAEPVELAPRALSDLGTSKNFFFRQLGVASITYEVADEANRIAVAKNANVFADGVVAILGEEAGDVQIAGGKPCTDLYCFLFEANKASLVMLHARGLIEPELARRLVIAIERVEDQVDEGSWEPSANYLDLEAKLIDIVGSEAANLHIGRSRQDLHGTARRMKIRHQLLELIDAATLVRKQLLVRAERDSDIVIPAYTHGVPSQPTTFGHQCLAFADAIGRDIDRFIHAFKRMNVSQLGVAAGNTSGFALDREQLAHLLGFDRPVVNAYDANFLSTADYKVEIGTALAQSALTINQFVQNVHSQQRNPRPWIYLTDDLTSGSSIMPQKRNPRPLDRLRSRATEVIGLAQTQMLLVHNLETGMHDYRKIDTISAMLEEGVEMYRRYVEIVDDLVVDRVKALADIKLGYSTSTEIADTLFRDGQVPFRDAHVYVAKMVGIARSKGSSLNEIADDEWNQVFREMYDEDLPVSVPTLKSAADPEVIVKRRKGLGGPQKVEMFRQISQQKQALENQRRFARGVYVKLDQRRFEMRKKLAEIRVGE